MRGKGIVSSRFYEINFSTSEKDYYNTVLSLMAYNYVPKWVVRFFRTSDKPVMRILLSAFNKAYSAAHQVKEKLKQS